MRINAAKLRAYLDTMHGHADARDMQSESIRRVVLNAKKDGFDTKALRKVFVRERMDPEKRQTEDDILTAYENALGGKWRAIQAIEQGATLDQAAEIGGVHRATVARAKSVAKQASDATPAYDAVTGEITETASEPPPSPASEFGVGAGTAPECPRALDGGACTRQWPESEASLVGEAEAPTPISPQAPAASSTVTARAPDEVSPRGECTAADNPGGDHDGRALNSPSQPEVARAAPPSAPPSDIDMDAAQAAITARRRALGLPA
ncbi:MAG: GapR family DNA-binding domain-containing protein [Pseudomonadota bacterium]